MTYQPDILRYYKNSPEIFNLIEIITQNQITRAR